MPANLFASIPNQQLREAIECAVSAASERESSLFIAVRMPRRESVECFFAEMSEPLCEFLESCAKHTFPAWDRGNLEEFLKCEPIGDPDIRVLAESAIETANHLGCWIFCVFCPVLTRKFTFVSCGVIPSEIAKHLCLCFQVAIVAYLGRS